MIIDCDCCTAGPRACPDCVVTFLTVGVSEPAGSPPVLGVELDTAEEHALGVLAASGLVPPLRMQRTG